MTAIYEAGIFEDRHIIEAIERLNKIDRVVQLSTLLQDLHEHGLYTRIEDYGPLYKKLYEMHKKGLLEPVPLTIDSNKKIELKKH